MVLVLFLLALSGCGKDAEPRKVLTKSPTVTTIETEKAPKTTVKPALTFDDAVERCGEASDEYKCYADAVTRFSSQITEQNAYAYVSVCKRIPSIKENQGFVASDFSWTAYPTLRMQCFRQFTKVMEQYGDSLQAAKELCDDLQGHGISSGEDLRWYCYKDIAAARQYSDTMGAEDLCQYMPDPVEKRACCQGVYGKFNNDADKCTKRL